MDHSFRPRSRPSDFQTSAAQQEQQNFSQVAAGPSEYPLAHPHLRELMSYSYELRDSAFNLMELPAHVPEQSSSVPSTASFAPTLRGPLQGLTHEPSLYDIPEAGSSSVPLVYPAATLQGSGAMPMYEDQGFVFNQAAMPQADALEPQPPFMQQQGRHHDSNFLLAPLPVMHAPSLNGLPLGEQVAFPEVGDAMPVHGSQNFFAHQGPVPQAGASAAPPFISPHFVQEQGAHLAPYSLPVQLPVANDQVAFGMAASYPWVPDTPSAVPGPIPRKRSLAEAEELPPKRLSTGGLNGTVSLYNSGALLPQNAYPSGAGTAPSALPGHPSWASTTSGPEKMRPTRLQVKYLAAEYRSEVPQSSYPFAKRDSAKSVFNRHRALLNRMGIEHLYQLNELLLACERACGGEPRDDEYYGPVTLNGYTAHVFWRVKDHKTALLTMAPDAERLKQTVNHIKKTEPKAQK